MAKIRHIAYRADDPEAVARFFVEAFEMSIVGRRREGVIDLSDGTINITVISTALPGRTSDSKGIEHIGFTAADSAAARGKVLAAGAREKNTLQLGDAHYEVKFEGPEGIVVDVGSWAGTAPVEGAA